MEETRSLRLQYIAANRGGKGEIRLTVNGEVADVDRLDISSAMSRQRYVNRLSKRFPAISADELREQLDQEAAEWANRVQSSDRTTADAPQEIFDQFAQSAEELRRTDPQVRAEAEDMARHPELLRIVYDDLCACGLVGEERLALTIYLAGVSRLLTKPMTLLVTGPPASGKSFAVHLVASLFPPEAVLELTDATPEAWYYLPKGSLRHRFVVLGERPHSNKPEAVDRRRAWRELLASGRLTKAVVTQDSSGKWQTHTVVQEGPIAFVETTSNARIFEEDESRLLLLQTDTSEAQTQAVVKQIGQRARDAEPEARKRKIQAKHHALIRLLEPRDVTVPFAEHLVEHLSGHRHIQLRRLVPQIMSTIRASALLHQFQRPRDGEAVQATREDYEIAYELLRLPAAIAVGAGLGQSFREILDRLADRFGRKCFTTTDAVEAHRNISARWVRQALRELANAGLVEMVEAARGQKPASWRVVASEPAEGGVLPTPETLFGGT